jgi:glycosyltransferase involved in cell wall biosynthesis
VSPSAVFFARVAHPSQIDIQEFYAQDVQFLKDLGYRVRIVTRLRDLLRTPPADLYFCWWWTWAAFPVMIARVLRRPVVITGTFNHHLFRGRPASERLLIRFAAKRASANIFVSRLECEIVAKTVDVHNPFFSPHTVDADRYCPPAGGADDRDTTLLLTSCQLNGGSSKRKCVAESIRAVAQLQADFPGARLTVMGEKGDDYPALAALAESLGVAERITFVGCVTQEEKIHLMRRCGIYLQPSRFEGFGLAALEAMACGATVLTSPVGAVPEVGGDAVAYADGTDPTALAAEIRALLHDSTRRAMYGEAARLRAVSTFAPARRREGIAAVLRAVGSSR